MFKKFFDKKYLKQKLLKNPDTMRFLWKKKLYNVQNMKEYLKMKNTWKYVCLKIEETSKRNKIVREFLQKKKMYKHKIIKKWKNK